jgi:hypothetical protein
MTANDESSRSKMDAPNLYLEWLDWLRKQPFAYYRCLGLLVTQYRHSRLLHEVDLPSPFDCMNRLPGKAG